MSFQNRILLLDDDPEEFELLHLTMKRQGSALLQDWGLEFFHDPLEALAWLEASMSHALPRLMVVDFSMPAMNGLEFLGKWEQMRVGKAEPVPAYLLTSLLPPDVVARAKEIPILKGYGEKPLDARKLAEIRDLCLWQG